MKTGNNYSILYKVNNINRSFKLQIDKKINPSTIQAIVHKILTVNHPENLGADQEITFYASTINQNTQLQISYTVGHGNRIYSSVGALPSGEQPPDIQGTTFTIIPTIRNCPSFLKNYTRFIRSNPAAAIIGNIFVFIFIAPAIALYRTLSSSGEERESARITRKQLGALTIDHPIKLRRLLQRRLHQLESIGDSVGASICRESIRSMYLIDQASSSSKKLGNSLDKIMEQVTTSAHPSIIPFWHWDSDHFIPFLTSITRTDPAQPPLVAKYKIQFNRGWAGKEESTELPFETEYSDFTEAQIKHLLHAILITNQARKPQSMSIPGSKSLTDYIRFPEGLVVDEFDIEKFKKITQGGIINIEDYLEKAKKLLLSNDYRTCSQAVFDLAEMIHSQNNPPPPVEPDEKTPLRSFTKGHKPKNGWELVFKGMKNIQGYADRSKFLIDTLNEELTVYLKGFHRLDLSAQELALQQLESHLKDLRELLDEGDLSESRENLSSIASIFSAKIEELKKRRAEVIAKQETTVVSTSTKGLKTEKEPRIGVQVDKKQLPKPQHSKTVDYQPTHVLYKEKLDQLRLAFNNIKPESIGSIEKLYDELLVDLNALLDQGEYQAAYTISLEMQKMIPHINNNPPSFWLSPYFRSQADKLAGNQTHLYFDRINQWSQRITNLTKFQWEASLKLQKFDVAPEVIYQNLKLKGILISLIYNRYLIGKKAENKDDPKTKAALIFEKFNIDLSEMKLILHHPFGALSVEEQQMIEETFLTIEGLAAQHDNGPTTLDTTKLIEFSYDSYVKKWRETHPEPRDDALLVVKANDEIAREGAKKIPTRESNEGEEFLTNELVDFLEFSIYFDTMVSPSNVLFTDFSKRNVGTWSQLAMIEFFHEDERLAKMRDEHLLIVKNRLAKMKRLKIAHIHKVMTHAFLISDPTNSFAAGVSLWHDNSSVSKVTYSKAVYDYEKKQITQSHLTGYDPVAYLGRAARWAQTYIHKEVASICTDSQSYWSIKPTARPYLNRAASTEYSTYETAMRSESTNPVADALLSGTRHVFSPKKYFLEMSEFNLEHALHTIIARPDLIDLDGGVEYLEFLIHQPFAIQKMLKTEKGFDRVVRLVNQLVQITMEKKEGNIHTHCMLLKVIDAIKQTGIRLNVQPDFFQQLPSYYDNEELANFLGTKLRGDDSDVAKYHLIAITVQKLAKNGHDTACLSNSEHKLLFSAVPFLAYVKQRYGIPFKNEEMISYINTAYLPELLKPQNREFLQSFIEPLYRLQESTLDEFVEKTPTFKKFPPIKPNGPWTQIPAKPFLFENGEYQLNIFTGQFTIRGKIAPSTPFEGTLQKKIIDSPLFKRHFDHIPDFIKIRQGATPSEWVYLFKQNGREFEIVSNDESAEFVVRVKIESKDSKYPTTQWFQWMESEEQTGSGIGKAIAEAGIWVSTTNPKKGLYILNRTKNWPKHDFYRINLNGNGEITKMINPHDEIVTADFDLHLASFFRQSDPKNIIFSRHPKGTKLSRVRLTDFPLELELRDQQWHGIGNYSNFMSTYNGEIGTTECQKKSKELFTAIGGTGYDVILRLGDQKQQKWIIWPKKIVRQVGIQKEHTELATVGPVELTINENGQLSGSAATFFYLAYIFFQKKDFKSALQFLNEAKKHPINNDMEQFQEIQKLIRAEPSQSRRSAIFLLKAELFAFNLQTQFVKSIDKVELAQLALSLNNKYQILQVKQGIPATERRNLTTPITSIELKRGEQSLELTREEHRQLIHLFKGANAQLVKDASERSESTKKVTLGTAQTQPALSQNAKGFIIGLTKKAPQTDPEKQELLSAKSLSAVDFIANFLFYYNEIINTHDAEYPFLYVPFRELSSLGKLTPREKKLIAAAQEAQRFLLHVKGSHRDFQPIDINAIIRERKNILPMPVRVNSPGSTVRSLLSGPLKIAGRKISAPFIRLFTDQKRRRSLATPNVHRDSGTHRSLHPC